MKSLIVSIAIVGLLGLAVGTGAGAADIAATVTPRLVSITVSPSSVAYGFVDVPSTDNVPTGDTIISVENTGNVNENFDIKGADAAFGIGGSVTWTIVDTAPGATSYNHKFLDCDADSSCASPTAANSMTTTLETLGANVSAGLTEYFQLRLSTPTETGGDITEHSTTVTVLATAS